MSIGDLRSDEQVAVITGAGGDLGKQYALLVGYTVFGGPADEMGELFATIMRSPGHSYLSS
jgi:hypothetical protein